MAVKAAPAMPGPTILHVGERSPKDKKYQTSEVVLAAPGTVVAPIPKGMPVNQDNAIMLILMQILKALGMGGAPGADPNAPAGAPVGAPGMAMPPGGPPMGPPGAVPGSSQGTISTASDPWASLAQMASAALGNRTQGFNELSSNRNFQLANQQAGQPGAWRNPALQSAGGSAAEQASQANNQSNRSLANSLTMNREQQAADNAWHYAQIAQQREAATASNTTNNRQLTLQNEQAQRGLDLNAAQEAFQQIMAGLAQASLPGVRAGNVPATGLYG